jgi:hypothetical protein
MTYLNKDSVKQAFRQAAKTGNIKLMREIINADPFEADEERHPLLYTIYIDSIKIDFLLKEIVNICAYFSKKGGDDE